MASERHDLDDDGHSGGLDNDGHHSVAGGNEHVIGDGDDGIY